LTKTSKSWNYSRCRVASDVISVMVHVRTHVEAACRVQCPPDHAGRNAQEMAYWLKDPAMNALQEMTHRGTGGTLQKNSVGAVDAREHTKRSRSVKRVFLAIMRCV
jgi:hypothetical protein